MSSVWGAHCGWLACASQLKPPLLDHSGSSLGPLLGCACRPTTTFAANPACACFTHTVRFTLRLEAARLPVMEIYDIA